MTIADDDAPRPGIAAPSVRSDRWAALRAATPARIGLDRQGDTVGLGPVLAFQRDHAQARDAVHAALDSEALKAVLAPNRTVTVRSAATDRSLYLRRPDLGRILDPADRAGLQDEAVAASDCVFVLADGLSAVAAQRHAAPLLARCLPALSSLTIAPLVIATQARVALGDEIGACLRARLCIVLIGERPGLSVADSLGAYVTFDPRTGRRDSERNCISNIHGRGGLGYDEAAQKLCWLIKAALDRKITGVTLKDEEPALLAAPGDASFYLGTPER